MDINSLCIGDFITLRTTSSTGIGWLTAEGIVDESCFTVQSTPWFENCLWEVHVQRQYSAKREFDEAVLSQSISEYEEARLEAIQRKKDTEIDSDSDDGSVKENSGRSSSGKMLQKVGHKMVKAKANDRMKAQHEKEQRQALIRNLERSVENEIRMNDKLMAMKSGKPVSYGDIIQLRHVKSRKFVTVSMMQLARQERENMRVNVEKNGSVMSYLAFAPRFRSEREGELVRESAETLIRVHERSSEFLHGAKHTVVKTGGKEVENAAIAEVNCSLENSTWTVDRYQRFSDIHSHKVYPGQVVSLMEAETSSYLSVEQLKAGEGESNLNLGTKSKVVMSTPQIMAASNFSNRVGTSFLWLVESERFLEGGTLLSRESRVCLRNLNTDMYLSAEGDILGVVPERARASLFEMAFVGTDVNLVIPEEIGLQLTSSGRWICRRDPHDNEGDEGDDASSRQTVVMREDRSKAITIKMSGHMQRDIGVDMLVGVRAMRALRSFEEALSIHRERASADTNSALEEHARQLITTFDLLLNFFDVQEYDFEKFKMDRTNSVMSMRQTMLREQGVLDAIIDIIRLCSNEYLTSLNLKAMRRAGVRRRRGSRATQRINTLQYFNLPSGSDHHRKTPGSTLGALSEESENDDRAARLTTFARSIRGTVHGLLDGAAKVGSEISGRASQLLSGDASMSPYAELPRGLQMTATGGSRGLRAPANPSDSGPAPLRKRRESSMIGTLAIGGAATGAGRSLPTLSSGRSKLGSSRAGSGPGDSGKGGRPGLKREASNVFRKEKSHATFRDNDDDFSDKSNVENLVHMGFFVLFVAMKDNHINQSHLADYFPVFFDHAQVDMLAIACLDEMLKDNDSILHTKVRAREMNHIVSLLHKNYMSVTYLTMLRNTCSCKGGVDTTQRLVTRALFGETATLGEIAETDLVKQQSLMTDTESVDIHRELVMNIHCMKSTSNNQKLKIKRFYLSPVFSDHKGKFNDDPKDPYFVMGRSLMKGDNPAISFSWPHGNVRNNDGEWSMMVLFGCEDTVPLESLAKVHKNLIRQQTHHKKHRASVARASSIRNVRGESRILVMTDTNRRRQEVVKYLIAQLYLVADLCLDRQYVAMGLLEPLYPYDALVSMLRQVTLATELKAPICKILRTLYVDKEPQVAGKFPRLIRTSMSLQGGEEESLGNHHTGSLYTFVILQQWISDYLHGKFNATQCDELSQEVMDLLEALVRFGFYTTEAQLRDVAEPLVAALDSHRRTRQRVSALGDGSGDSQSGVHDDDDFARGSRRPIQKYSFHGNLAGVWARMRAAADVVQRVVGFATDSKPRAVGGFIVPEDGHTTVPKKRRNSEIAINARRKSSLSNANALLGISVTKDAEKLIESLEEKRTASMWQAKLLAFFDSVTVLVIVLVLVMMAVVLAVLGLRSSSNDSLDEEDIIGWDRVISYIFIAEIAVRSYCFYAVHDNFLGFFERSHNTFDFVLVVLDIVYMITSMYYEMQVLMWFRVLRVLRITRLANKIREASQKVTPWVLPHRYQNVSEMEVRTLESMLRNLSEIQDRIIDRRLGYTIRAFVDWFDSHSSGNDRDPNKVYAEKTMSEDDLRTVFPTTFEDVLLDIVMHDDARLVDAGLRLLMAHSSHDALVLQATKEMQIIYSPSTEMKLKSISGMLRDLNRYAEMFEIWGELRSQSDDQTYTDMLDAITNMQIHLTKRNTDAKFGCLEESAVDEEVQRLMLNMDAMTCFMQIEEALHDTSAGKPQGKIATALRACNELICMFVKDNDANQTHAFRYLDFFIDRTEDGVSTGKVAREILQGNRHLIKQCSRTYIYEFANKIMTHGRKAEYLDLLVGMTGLSNDGTDAGVRHVRNEICRVVTSREWNPHVLMWCCSADQTDYQKRREAMAPYVGANAQPVSDSDLPAELQYHLNLLTLLTGCRLGPKLQAIYPIQDVITAILDEGTCHNVRMKLGVLLREAIASGVDMIEGSEHMWKFTDYVIDLFRHWSVQLGPMLRKNYNQAERKQKAEWISVTLSITTVFLETIDLSSFEDAVVMTSSDLQFEVTKRSEEAITEVLGFLMDALEGFLNEHQNNLDPSLVDSVEYVSSLLLAMGLTSGGDNEMDDTEREERVNRARESTLYIKQRQQANIVTFADIQQVYYRAQFVEFSQKIFGVGHELHTPSVQLFEKLPSRLDTTASSDVRIEPLITKLSQHVRSNIVRTGTLLTVKEGTIDSTLWLLKTFRYIIERHAAVTVTQVCNEEASRLHKEQKGNRSTANAYQSLFNSCGVTHLCIDLMAQGIEHNLGIEAMKLLVMLLWRSGGNDAVQTTMLHYLQDNDSIQFFEQIKEYIDFMLLFSQRETDADTMGRDIMRQALDNYSNAINVNRKKALPEKHKSTFVEETLRLPEEAIALKVLQLMCTGFADRNRNFLREQDGNSHVSPILEVLAQYIDILSVSNGASSTYASIKVLQTIQRLMHGPCRGNQDFFVMRTDLLSSLNRIMRISKRATGGAIDREGTGMSVSPGELLQESVIDVLSALLEGQGTDSVVLERVSTSIELNVLNMLIFSSEQLEDDSNDWQSSISALQSKYLVLLATLGKRAGAIPVKIRQLMDHHVAFVDIVYRQEVHRNYFHIPYIVEDLSGASVERIYADIDHTTHELKLRGFCDGAFQLFVDVMHQQNLKRFGIGNVWSMKDILSWIMLLIAVIMNGLVLFSYKAIITDHHNDGDDDHRRYLAASTSVVWPYSVVRMPSNIAEAVRALNVVQIVLASLTFTIYLIVRLPVVYRLQREEGASQGLAVATSIIDPRFLWYTIYLFVCVFAYVWKGVKDKHRPEIYLSILLLDFMVITKTTTHLLKAVIYPFKQLVATLTIMCILITVFNGFIFEYARYDSTNIRLTWLWDAWKQSLSYGIRGEHGVAHELVDTVDDRLIMDFVYYLIIVSILRNIFFGIIIDTFGKLREEEMEQVHQANNECFVCGVAKNEFDKRSIPGANTFKNHREVIHNKYSYMYFLMKSWYSDSEDDNGVEMHVRRCIAIGDMSWFPNGMTAEEMETHMVPLAMEDMKKSSATDGGGGGGGGGGGIGNGKDMGGDNHAGLGGGGADDTGNGAGTSMNPSYSQNIHTKLQRLYDRMSFSLGSQESSGGTAAETAPPASAKKSSEADATPTQDTDLHKALLEISQSISGISERLQNLERRTVSSERSVRGGEAVTSDPVVSPGRNLARGLGPGGGLQSPLGHMSNSTPGPSVAATSGVPVNRRLRDGPSVDNLLPN